MARPTQAVIYDDSCRMCSAQMRFLVRLDWRDALRLIPISSPDSLKLAPQVTSAELREAIHCVAPNGRVFRGARAFRHLGFRVPAMIPLGLILWIPGVMWVAEKIYMAVSRNRYVLSRGFGCDTECAYAPPGDSDGVPRDPDEDPARDRR